MPEPTSTPADCFTSFAPFTLFHIVTVAACLAAMLASSWYGHLHRGTPRERAIRLSWGWSVIAYQTLVTIWWFLPANYDIQISLPFQLCDLAAFVAGFALVTQQRWLRSLLYFWGIGLSTQAFCTPTVREGLGTVHYWLFWVGHTAIVGSAVYDLVVGGFRPRLRDFLSAWAVTIGYAAGAVPLNVALGVNYGFVGNMEPQPGLVGKLGAWPGRVFVLFAIVTLDYLMLWAVWPLARRLTGKQDPLARPERAA